MTFLQSLLVSGAFVLFIVVFSGLLWAAVVYMSWFGIAIWCWIFSSIIIWAITPPVS